MGDVAFAAGFSSIRTFNDTVREVFALSPSELRERAVKAGRGRNAPPRIPGTISLRLPFRAPLNPTTSSGTSPRPPSPGSRSGARAPTTGPCVCPTAPGSSP